MLKPAFAACVLLCALTVTAEARPRHTPACIETGTAMKPSCMGNNFLSGIRSISVTLTRERPARAARPSRHSARAVHRHIPRNAAPAPSYAAGIVSPLAAKVSEIVSACGSRVISGVRHTRIAGTRRLSLHATGKAVDLQGNPSCMYAMLHGWQGGYSIDYTRVHHLHLSFDPDGGREMGLRFRHGGHRYARRHHRHQRFASAR